MNVIVDGAQLPFLMKEISTTKGTDVLAMPAVLIELEVELTALVGPLNIHIDGVVPQGRDCKFRLCLGRPNSNRNALQKCNYSGVQEILNAFRLLRRYECGERPSQSPTSCDPSGIGRRRYRDAISELFASLQARIEELEKRLGKNSSYSNKPLSNDGLKRTKSQLPKNSGRKPGGEPGHLAKLYAKANTPISR